VYAYFSTLLQDSPFDCSVFDNEEQIIESLPFPVSIHPANRPTFGTYVMFGNQPNIFELWLFNQTSVPPAIFCLKYLQKLVIQSCNGPIPEEIGLLSSTLTYLEISTSNTNNLTRTALNLPSQVFNLSRLDTLILSGYDLGTLSSAIGQLVTLTRLKINNCGLETTPETIQQLSKLSTFELIGNRLSSLPMGMNRLNNLQYIDVSNNPLLSSLDALQGPRSLISLTATNCSIDHLPLYISALNTLDLSNNKLTSLNGIETLQASNGKYSFSNNQIEFIPISIGQLSLYTLKLDSNKLTTVPAELFSYHMFSELNLQGNSISDKSREWITGLARYDTVKVFF
jgi:Leucine-rich repeat (LRR) protein